jgi:hypothetical protein
MILKLKPTNNIGYCEVSFGEQLDSMVPAGYIHFPPDKLERAVKALAEAYGAERNWVFFNGVQNVVASPPDKLVVVVDRTETTEQR